MKTFIIRDFKVQSILVTVFLIVLVVDLVTLNSGYSTIFYFLIALNHLVSANVRFFSTSYSRKITFKIYYVLSMAFMILLLLLITSSELRFHIDWINNIGMIVLYFGMFCTPILAIFYYFFCYYEYQNTKAIKI